LNYFFSIRYIIYLNRFYDIIIILIWFWLKRSKIKNFSFRWSFRKIIYISFVELKKKIYNFYVFSNKVEKFEKFMNLEFFERGTGFPSPLEKFELWSSQLIQKIDIPNFSSEKSFWKGFSVFCVVQSSSEKTGQKKFSWTVRSLENSGMEHLGKVSSCQIFSKRQSKKNWRLKIWEF